MARKRKILKLCCIVLLVACSKDDGGAESRMDSGAKPSSPSASDTVTASAATSSNCRASRDETPGTLVVRTTLGWGCPCPHFAVPATPSLDPMDRFLYPVFSPGVSDAATHWVLGSFHLVGRYTGECMTYVEWKRHRGESAELDEGRNNAPQPVFLVKSWCYEPNRPPDKFDIPAEDIQKHNVAVCK
ncbi:hypothetical protein JYT28_01100 [Desulfobulbus sp. AH-315-M07]|nr:hypothetical protein [Desulfobulbus sp. AH-315-M07]